MEMLEHRLVLSTLFTVTNTADSGEGSLRWAIENANGTFGADAITFDSSFAGESIVLGGTELSISDDLTITGLGADKLTISGNNASRVFSIAAGVTAEISGVTIANGNEAYHGGGIYNQGTLTVTQCTFSENTAGNDGGAITNCDGAMLTITRSTFSQNAARWGAAIFNWYGGEVDISNSLFTQNEGGIGGAIWNVGPANITDIRFEANNASAYGGAIANQGPMTVSNCTFEQNSSGSASGAIDNTSGILKVFNSTFFGNSTGWEGGAIENNEGTLEIANSTISGNSSEGPGGGIWNLGELNITNSTIFGNRADALGEKWGTGGGLYNYSPWWSESPVLMNNTLLAGNVVGAPGSDTPDDIDGTVTADSAHNLIGDPATAGGLVHGEDGNIVGDGAGGTLDIATVLDPNLADNGGPTLTRALVPGGLAVNAGDNGKVVSEYDQRGEGFARIYAGTVDIGALEVQSWFAQIDIKPGSDPNSINLASKGVIPVAIYTTDDFDASLVNASTVQFAEASAVHWALEDVDGDGDLDMVLHFRVQDTNLADLYAQLLAEDIAEDGVLDSNRQTAAVSLTGQTATDEYFAGFDEVDLFLSGKNLRDLLE